MGAIEEKERDRFRALGVEREADTQAIPVGAERRPLPRSRAHRAPIEPRVAPSQARRCFFGHGERSLLGWPAPPGEVNVRRWTSAFLAVFILAIGTACGPQYPYCDSDDDCRDRERCVIHQCQQCATANDCAAGERCLEGRCE